MEIAFPVEFIVAGTPVSSQSTNSVSKTEWKDRIRDASSKVLPAPHLASTGRVGVTLYYLPQDQMTGDLDNIIKLILDGMKQHVYVDDQQVERIVVQKFEPETTPALPDAASLTLRQAWTTERPLLYVRVSDTIDQEVN